MRTRPRRRGPPITASTPVSGTVAATVARARVVVETSLDTLGPRLLDLAGQVEPTSKADGTPVTDADVEADVHLADAIADHFPGHGILSEERDTVAPGTDWCWIVDPIDGTSNFTTGLPYWCVSIALTFEGEVVLAVVDAPPLRTRMVATAGGGTEVGGRQVRVRDPVDWRDGRYRHVPVMLTTGTARRARGAGLRLNARVMGSTALDLGQVAAGVAAASVAAIPKVWDIAAGSLLVREAGGEIATLSGPDLLPLRPGVEHAGRSSATAAGPTASYAADLATALLPS